MKRFTQLFTELEETNRINDKVAAVEAYFREAGPADAAWALFFLCGRKLPRAVTSTALRDWAAEEAKLPPWLVEECYDAVGDLAEAVALLLPETEPTTDLLPHEPRSAGISPASLAGVSPDTCPGGETPLELAAEDGRATWFVATIRVQKKEVRAAQEPRNPLTPSLSPSGGDARRAGEGEFGSSGAMSVQDLGSSLHELVEQRLRPMRDAPEKAKKNLLLQTWRELNAKERLVWNKLITGEFRIGVAQGLVVRALAAVAGIEPAIMAHRVMGRWQPTPGDFQNIMNGHESVGGEVARPYPFFLASPLEGEPSELGDIADWQFEWKWDGIRAQLIRRQGEVLVWSRGEEMVTEMFPEITAMGRTLPNGTVLDGEILAWEGDLPQPFGRLQRRLGRKKVSAKLRDDFPVVFLAYDLLEWGGGDWRMRPLNERRRQLELMIDEVLGRPLAETGSHDLVMLGETPELFPALETRPVRPRPLRLSVSLQPSSWMELAALQRESRSRQVEGIMLKRKSSVYGVGRQRGDWWKWKVDPLVIDAVLINAQLGHGRRASLYTDYTFGLWHENELVPVAKAYSGLSNEEILEVDAFVRANTTDRFGPIRAVKPSLVFELAFEAVQESARHKAGIAVRFPRMNRWRRDKTAKEADTLESLRALMQGEARR